MDMALDTVVPESLPWEHVDEGKVSLSFFSLVPSTLSIPVLSNGAMPWLLSLSTVTDSAVRFDALQVQMIQFHTLNPPSLESTFKSPSETVDSNSVLGSTSISSLSLTHALDRFSLMID